MIYRDCSADKIPVQRIFAVAPRKTGAEHLPAQNPKAAAARVSPATTPPIFSTRESEQTGVEHTRKKSINPRRQTVMFSVLKKT